MSPRGTRFRAECQKKVRFRSEDRARHSLAKYRDEPDGPDMNSYRCSFCSHWHLGHVPDQPLDRRQRYGAGRSTPSWRHA
jgi:hypothetical protein